MEQNCTIGGCGSLLRSKLRWEEVDNEMGWLFWSQLVTMGVGVAFLMSVGMYYWLTWGRPWAGRFNKLDGPWILPFIGCGWLLLNPDNVHEIIGQWAAKLQKSGRFWLGTAPYFITTDVEVIGKILSNPLHVQKAESYTNSHFLVGQGLVAAGVDKWRHDRKLMAPCMKSSNFPGYLGNFNKNSAILIKILRDQTSPKDTRQYFGRCMMDIVFETLLDTQANVQGSESQFYEAFTECFHLVESKMFYPWIKFPLWWYLGGYARLEKENMAVLRKTINEDIIQRKMEELSRDAADNAKQSLAKILYQECTDAEDVFHQFLTLLAGGYDTTSTVLSQTLYLLALNEGVLSKLVAELDTVFGEDSTRDVTYADLSALPYLEAVLKESMRFLTPTPMLGRTLGADLDLGGGRGVVPAGANVVIPTFHVQHDSQVWEEPETFIPERFANVGTASSWSYLPFSGGPRGCFAPKFAMMSMKVILAWVLRHYGVSTEKTLDSCVFHYGVVLHVKGGLPLTLVPRKIKEIRAK